MFIFIESPLAYNGVRGGIGLPSSSSFVILPGKETMEGGRGITIYITCPIKIYVERDLWDERKLKLGIDGEGFLDLDGNCEAHPLFR